jgi:RimJ/RimL family protein N-acetyltransferase
VIELHAMTDRDFAWLAGEIADQPAGLRLCDRGVAPPEVVAMLRGIAAEMAATAELPVAWLIVEAGEAVGMISFTARGEDGRYAVGYGIAPAFGGSGRTTRALARMLDIARAAGLHGLTADTSVANPASQRVLEKNGFQRTGTRDDEEDGALVTWAIDLR